MALKPLISDSTQREIKTVVIVPVHKPQLTTSENIALVQCFKILKNYDIYLIYPEGMNIEIYKNNFPEIIFFPVPVDWLASLQAYNYMKCSLAFYTLFKAYDFMLSYEPDAYIFSDDWRKANVFDYDYIGAPWFKDYKEEGMPDKVGNSGFSMRKIATCIHALEMKAKFMRHWRIIYKLKLNKFLKVSILFKFFGRSFKLAANNYYYYRFFLLAPISEDIFWSSIVPRVISFRLAPVEDAIKFSFEKKPDLLYQINQNSLPLGCHGWMKYNPAFWKQFIE